MSKDLTGLVFGRLIVKEFVDKTVRGDYRWRCICECGKSVVTTRGHLTGGHTKSCGCLRVRCDLTGLIFGNLTVIGKSSYKPGSTNTQAHWNCVCSCGNSRVVAGQALREGKSLSCHVCYRPVSMIVGASINALYSQYRHDAKDRKITFELSPETFRKLIKQDCIYCGIAPFQRLTLRRVLHPDEVLVYNGIDRVNNSLGYRPENCVPCCGVCNVAKRAMTRDQFLAWIKRVYEHNYA